MSMFLRSSPTFAILLSALFVSSAACVERQANDVTEHLEVVGNPLEKTFPSGDRIYARNIWDLQAFEGKLYLGHGNSSNHPPAPNAGPVSVIYYSPDEDRFVSEYRVGEEQISLYRIIDGKLHIPGHDPADATSSAQIESIYRLEEEGWQRFQTLRNAIHCYDLYGFHGELFAALGTWKKSVVAISTDQGKSWRREELPGWRAYSLFELDSELYTCTSSNGIFTYTGHHFRPAAPITALLTGLEYSRQPRLIVRPTDFQGSLVYIGAVATNAHQWDPFALYTASSFKDARQVDLPGKPYDIVVRHGVCTVLLCTTEAISENETKSIVQVFGTSDLVEWKELLQFECDTFARSFEILDGDFYFGLGCNVRPLPDSTGRILRVRGEHLPGSGIRRSDGEELK